MKYIRDDDIKSAFVTMLNKLIYGHRLILAPYLKALENSSGDEAIQRIQHLELLLAQNSEQRETLTKLMAQGYICLLYTSACQVELANSEEEINILPNAKETLSIYTENDIETCRDVLAYTAQVLGGFFLINREGKLEFKKYGSDPVMEIHQKHRFSSSFSDFVTRYTAVSSTNKRTQISEYYALKTDDGLTMNLGINPLLQFGLDETRETLCRNILADLSVIQYVPFDSDTIGNPALDVGDVLVFSGGQADSQQITCRCV